MAALLAWPACTQHAPAPDAPIEVALAQEPDTLDPRHAVDGATMRVTRLLHAGLARLDEVTLEPRPYVADHWEWEDARTLRVHLRDGLRFHSGHTLTARDVIATYDAWKDPQVGSRHGRIIEPIESVESVGTGDVRFRLRRSHATLLTDLELPILRADEAYAPPQPNGTLDGLGPFRVDARSLGAIHLVPATGGPLPAPRHRVTLRVVRDENARALRLRAGETDVASQTVSPTLVPALAHHAGVTLNQRPGATLTYLLVRVDAPPLNDVRVRQALSLSIDRPLLTRTLLSNLAEPACSLIPPGHWAHTPCAPLPFDPEAARAHVARRPLRPLRLMTSTDRLRTTLARTLAQGFSDVGIPTEVTSLELGTLLVRLGAGDFDLAILQWTELTEPNVLRIFLHSTRIPPEGSNRGRLRDMRVDTLLDIGGQSMVPELRKEVYAELDAYNRERAYVIPLWHEAQVALVGPRAKDFVPSAEGRWLGLASLP